MNSEPANKERHTLRTSRRKAFLALAFCTASLAVACLSSMVMVLFHKRYIAGVDVEVIDCQGRRLGEVSVKYTPAPSVRGSAYNGRPINGVFSEVVEFSARDLGDNMEFVVLEVSKPGYAQQSEKLFINKPDKKLTFVLRELGDNGPCVGSSP